MDNNQILIDLSARLVEMATKSTVTFISDKVRAAKVSGDKDKTINELEKIIDELINDKRELIDIASKFDEITSFQKITDEDVKYITMSIVPVLEELLTEAANLSDEPDASDELQDIINLIKPIVSVETLNILQLLGFNFRNAIGEPLTELTKSLILSQADSDLKAQTHIKNQEVTKEYYKIIQDKEAYNRLLKLSNIK